MLLNSNHLGVSKFVNAADSNYSKVRDALLKAVDGIEEECRSPYNACYTLIRADGTKYQIQRGSRINCETLPAISVSQTLI